MNLTLIGMAGAGKSYLGKKLAQEFQLDWVDSDVLLSEAHGGKDIQGILDELGEERYLGTEAKVCMDAARGRDNMLLSPAGSVIYVDEWMRFMRGLSKVVYLKVPFDTVEARLKKVPPRAIIGLGKKTLRELYDERHPLYEKNADLVLEPLKMSIEELIGAVRDFLSDPVDKERRIATV